MVPVPVVSNHTYIHPWFGLVWLGLVTLGVCVCVCENDE